ncbi:MAG: adenylyl-sulfate kinase [Sphingobacteriaceae bacterium]|nr:adenylyl-sulfate kinase [Sphingobacteriaceae bacterium]
MNLSHSNNIFSNQPELVTNADKENLLSHKGLVIWMTGYSGSGKTTLAYELERRLHDEGILTKVLDGDVLRQGINKGLGFSMEDRMENIRRTAELAKQLCSCGVVVICSLITPTNELRRLAENIIGEQHFILYHISTPMDVCELRDVKGHYAKARSGEIKEFTGVSNPFEEPTNAIYSIDTSKLSIDESVVMMFDDVFPLLAI